LVVELRSKDLVVASGLAGLLGPAAAFGGFGLALCATLSHR